MIFFLFFFHFVLGCLGKLGHLFYRHPPSPGMFSLQRRLLNYLHALLVSWGKRISKENLVFISLAVTRDSGLQERTLEFCENALVAAVLLQLLLWFILRPCFYSGNG
jgi:hypothetical protein